MMLLKLLSEMDRVQFPVCVISLREKGALGAEIEAMGVHVYDLGVYSLIDVPMATWRFFRIVRKVSPNLIQGWMYHGNLAASLAGLFAAKHVPVLWNVRQSLATLDAEKPMLAKIIRLCARFSAKPARIIYNSYTAARQHEDLGYCSCKTAIIPNGFNTQIFKPDSDARVLIRRELGISDESTLIGLVARYHPMKDHETFLQAAALLSQVYPTIYFVLVGDGVDESNPKLSEMVEKFNLKARFFMLGGRMDIPKITAALDVAVNVSWRGEAFPNALGEGMSCGIPCVVTDVGDSAWILGETGKVIPPRNSDALATAIKALLDSGFQSRQMLGALARRRVEESFSIEYVATQYSALYEQCISETKS